MILFEKELMNGNEYIKQFVCSQILIFNFFFLPIKFDFYFKRTFTKIHFTTYLYCNNLRNTHDKKKKL